MMELIGVSLATASIALIVSKSEVFKPLRNFLRDEMNKTPWMHKLINCPLCISVWVSIFFNLTCAPTVAGGWFINFFVGIFATVTLAMLFVGLMFKAISILPGEPDENMDREMLSEILHRNPKFIKLVADVANRQEIEA